MASAPAGQDRLERRGWRIVAAALAGTAIGAEIFLWLVEGQWRGLDAAIVLLGLGLMARAAGGRKLAAVLFLPPLALGLAVLGQLLFGLDPAGVFPPWIFGGTLGGMPPNGALAVAFVGTNLAVAALAPPHVARECLWAASLYALLVGAVKLFARASGQLDWFGADAFAHIDQDSAAALLLLGGAGLALIAAGRPTPLEKQVVAGLVAGVLLLFLLFNSALRAVGAQERYVERSTEVAAAQAERLVEQFVSERREHIDRLAHRWARSPGLWMSERAGEEMERILEDGLDYLYLALVPPAGDEAPPLWRGRPGIDPDWLRAVVIAGQGAHPAGAVHSGPTGPVLSVRAPVPGTGARLQAALDLRALAARTLPGLGEPFRFEVHSGGARGWSILAVPEGGAAKAIGLGPVRLLLSAGLVAGVLFYAALRASLVARYRRALLQRETRRLVAAQEVGRLGHWDLDLGSGRMDWSDAAVSMVSGDPDAMPSDWASLVGLAPAGDREGLRAGMVRLRAGQPWQGMHRLRRPGGGVRCFAFRAKPADGGIEGTVQDVTETVDQTHRLEHYARQLEQITDISLRFTLAVPLGDVVRMVARRSREIVGAGQAGVFLFGTDRREPLGAVAVPADHATSEQEVMLAESEVLRLLGPARAVTRLDRAHTGADPGLAERLASRGRLPHPAGLLLVPVVGRRDRIIGAAYFSDKHEGDFTADDEKVAQQVAVLVGLAAENHALVDRVTRLNEELEARVEQRTAMLRQVNEELEAFAYSVSHDLRAPLRAITGFVRILSERYADQFDEQGRHYLGRVSSGAERLARLIEDLLALSRVSRVEMRLRKLDLSATARDILEQLSASYPKAAEAAQVEPGLEAWGDPGLVSVALQNLLENACKYASPRDAPRVSFGWAGEAGENAFLVADNGVGFDMAYADKLFGVFQRLHPDSEFPGTGIGLATVRRIVVRHGGRIWVDAAPDQGARFYFTLAPEHVPAAGRREDADG